MKFFYDSKKYEIFREEIHNSGFTSKSYHAYENGKYVSGTTSKSLKETLEYLIKEKSLNLEAEWILEKEDLK